MTLKKLSGAAHEPIQSQAVDRFVKVPEICHMLSIGRSTWWRWVSEGKAPKGIHLGAKTTVWKMSEIQKLFNELCKEVA